MEPANDEIPFEQGHVPEKVVNGDSETQQPTQAAKQLYSIHLHGPCGTGKTHLAKKTLEEAEARVCHLSCTEHDTQYGALRRIYSELTGESIETGHHIPELQRGIREETGAVETIIVLGELDFLLLNDGDDLLYFLSRLETNGNLGLVLITANHQDLEERVEPRTYSTLQPQRIGFEPYTGEQAYGILADKVSKSLKPRTAHRAALVYIASSAQNTGYALIWSRTVVDNADDVVTGELVRKLQEKAYSLYVENQLSPLSQYYKIPYQAIAEASREPGSIVNTGSVYSRYEIIVNERGSTPLSGCRISDYLKQLE